MSVLSKIERAIQARSPIQFRYIREGKTTGLRIGNPHIVFLLRLSSGDERAYVLVWQTSGASDTEEDLPGWRQCFLESLEQVELLPEAAPFEVSSEFNRDHYEYPISSV